MIFSNIFHLTQSKTNVHFILFCHPCIYKQLFHKLKHYHLQIHLYLLGLSLGGIIMGTFQNVSKAEPCAICGKPDWCSVFLPDTVAYPGQKLCVCRRISDPEISSPINGKTYYFIKEFKDSSALYSDVIKDKNLSYSPNHFVHISNAGAGFPHTEPNYGIPPLKNSELDPIYRSFMQQLKLSKQHQRKLLSDGWNKDMILSGKIKSLQLIKRYDESKGFPTDREERLKICNELLKEHHSLKGVPGFYQDDLGRWTFSGKSGMLFPLTDRNGYLYRLRLRLDHPDMDENGKEKNKYKNFSSYFPSKENDRVINGFLNGCRAGSQIGFYYNPKRDTPNFCIITEGEKKAIVANYILHCIVISIPGVNNFSKLSETDEEGITLYDYLHSIGCQKIATAFDADKLVNNSVLQCENHLIDAIKKAGFETYICKWNFGFGKGLDDILLLGILPEYIQI